jgi:large subunit ribosomal protein L19e
MTNIASQKRMAADMLKCGTTRIKVTPSKEVDEALTREDVRILIRKGMIKKIRKKGSSRAAARKILAQKKKGRRKGAGSRKGKIRARMPKKKQWMITVKTLRSVIRDLRDSGRIERSDYRKLYRRVKGGMFRNRKHIMLYIKEHELLKAPSETIIKKAVKQAKPTKATKKPEAAKKPKAAKKEAARKPAKKAEAKKPKKTEKKTAAKKSRTAKKVKK